MLDTYREMEQRGSRVTVEQDCVRVEEGRWTFRYHSNGAVSMSGPARWVVEIQVAENRPEPFWRWVWRLLRQQP